MLRLMVVPACVVTLLASGAALGRKTVAQMPLGRSAVGVYTSRGMCLYSWVGQGMGVHRARTVTEQQPAWDGIGEARGASGVGFDGVVLRQNCPNPFNPVTVIQYTVSEGALVRLTIYDSSGRLVTTLVDEVSAEGGPRALSWDGTNDAGQALPSGVYFTRLEAAGQMVTRKMVLLK